MKKFFTPFAALERFEKYIIIVAWSVIALLLFENFHNPIVPPPSKIATALVSLIQQRDFIDDFLKSFFVTLKAMFYSIVITMILVYVSCIPFFNIIAHFVSRCRYLTLTGLVFLFTVLTSNVGELKMSLLLFGIVPFFVTSFLSVVEDPQVSKQLDKAYVNRLNRWQALYEIVIVGRLDQLFEVMRQNFAISWMMITTVEAYDMAGGGIGTMMLKANKQMHLAPVFATLVVVLVTGILFDVLLKWIRLLLFDYIKRK